MASAVESMTGMKSGKRKTHRGKRGGKSHASGHNKPGLPSAPKVPHQPLAALLGAGSGAGGAAPSVSPDPVAAAQTGGDPAVPHLIAALSALHGKGQSAPTTV